MSDSYSTRRGKKCVLYLRVSLERQVDGYSLEGQERYLKQWAEIEGMTVVDTYIDAGKSGKSILGRDEFQRMLDDISSKRINIDYVVVFKLSRFGRNVKDTLNSLSLLRRYGTNLICKEDGLDSSTSVGRLMIPILGAVVEMERENILAQSTLGREEKAKQGKWNGGLPPHGYVLKNSELVINEDEAKTIRLIYDKFVRGNMGYSAIVRYLNETGAPRPTGKTAHNRTFSDWSVQYVKLILQNPVYTGRIAYGRTKQKRVEGTENEFRRVKSKDYILGPERSHEPIIDDDLFEKAQLRRQEITASSHKIGRAPKHLLSGILRCPMCHSSMCCDTGSGRTQDGKKKKRPKYQCSHYYGAKGGACKKNAISAEWVETEVIEYTKALMQNPQFASDIQAQIERQTNGPDIGAEIESFKKQLKKLENSKANLERDIDNIADEDRNAERKRRDMNARLNKLYEDISSIEDQIESCEQKQQAVAQNILTLETVYKMLGAFDKLIDIMDAADKRKLMEILIAEVQLHPKETWQEGKSPIKSIKYTFPISGKVLDILGGNDFGSEGCNVKNVHTVNFRSYKESYKDKHAIKRPPEDWLVFENTHEAIVDPEMWALAQQARRTVHRTDSTGEANPLTGLVYCSDCGAKMYNHRGRHQAEKENRGKDPVSGLYPYDHYDCSTYALTFHRASTRCFSHYISTKALRALILDTIRAASVYAIENKAEFIRRVREASEIRQSEAAKDLKRKIAKAKRRSNELNMLIKKLYESFAKEQISEKRFEMLTAEYEKEQAELETVITAEQANLDAFNADTDRVEQFLALAKKYTDFSVLTTPMIYEFIEKIVVHAPEKIDGERTQEVEIYLKFIGKFDVPMPEPTPEELAEEARRKKERARGREKARRKRERDKAAREGAVQA